ncbi:hypothetical protein [Dactylosporangium sp. NPDC006015]|uniref:hypothetical protein n=1 Tax=Dactylosporangium sp. NPDC006015 TaxID=3154576 RepID=UPI0033B7858D
MNWNEIIIGGLVGWALGDLLSVFKWAALRIVPVAARLWTINPDRRAIYAEEWAALIAERPGGILKLGTALSFALGGLSRACGRRLHLTLKNIEGRLLRRLMHDLTSASLGSHRGAHPSVRALRTCVRIFGGIGLLPLVILGTALECLAARERDSIRQIVERDLPMVRGIALLSFSRRVFRAAAEVLGSPPTTR